MRLGNIKNSKYSKGFTLAEVLITLVIIGVIAAMTIPTLVVKYQKQETVSRLKKVYSTLSAAITRATTDYGYPTSWELVTDDEAGFAEKYLIPYLQVMKNCGTTHSSSSCKFNVKGVGNDINLSNYYKFILNDGTKVVIPFVGYSETNKYVYIVVDINGDKGPNKSGRDVFTFMLVIQLSSVSEEMYGKLIGVNASKSREYNLQYCLNNGSSYASINANCAALIMQDGWQIKDDYPW